MSAVMSARQEASPWRLAKALAWDAVPLRARVVIGFLYALIVLIFALVSGYLPEEKVTDKLPMLLALPTFMGWMLAWSSSLRAAMELRDWRAPRIHAAYWWALGLQLCATLLLPVILSMTAGAPPAKAFAIIGTAAAVGWLFSLMPGTIAWLTYFLPMVGYQWIKHAFPALTQTFWLPALGAVALLSMAAWRTWRMLHLASMETSGKLGRPVFMTIQNWNINDDVRSGTLAERMQQSNGWAQGVGAGHLPDLGPEQPLKAMRAWLGGACSRRDPRAPGPRCC